MKYQPNCIYHIYNQGNNKQEIFFEPDNYLYFTKKIQQFITPYADILCYCLMPNHFHLLVMANTMAGQPSKKVKARKLHGPTNSYHESEGKDFDYQENMSQAIATLLSSYTKAINKMYGRSGSLFRARTKVKNGAIEGVITIDGPNKDYFFRADNDYARQCFKYIHENPVKANLVQVAEEWPYSSALEYANGIDETICNKILAKEILQL